MDTTTTQSRKVTVESHKKRLLRLEEVSKKSKASGCVRCKSWDDFFKKLGLA